MAGYRDQQLISRVRKLLKRKDMQTASDTAVAEEAGCSRYTVRIIRTEMVAREIIPPPPNDPQNRYPGYADARPIKIRGGYVLDPVTGAVVREDRYAKLAARRPKR